MLKIFYMFAGRGRDAGGRVSAIIAGHYSYWVTIFLMMAGLYIVIARGNLLKKLVGLGIFQTSVYLLYIAPGKLIGGTAPIVAEGFTRVLQSAAARADPHRDRRRRRHARPRPRARGAHPRGLRHASRRTRSSSRTAPSTRQR